MKPLIQATKKEIYEAPTIPWNSATYTPVPNKSIMNMIEHKINSLGLKIKSEEYRATKNVQGAIKGVIGAYNITTSDGEFGQRVMFRNSYDKSMSFAIVNGSICWICENGMISGDYQYKRIHRGTSTETGLSTTMEDIIDNIDGSFVKLQASFEKTISQMNELKHLDISPSEAFNILGELFFNRKAVSITQMSIIKRELEFSKNFKHLGDPDFSAFDLSLDIFSYP